MIPYEFFPIVLGLGLIFGVMAFALLRRFLRDQQQMKLREMRHEERMKAMEKDLPLPELPADETVPDESSSVDGSTQGLLWLRLSALCIGLFMTFTGAGICIGFRLSGDSDLRVLWSVGILPAMAGLGLLLFFVLSRNVVPAGE